MSNAGNQFYRIYNKYYIIGGIWKLWNLNIATQVKRKNNIHLDFCEEGYTLGDEKFRERDMFRYLNNPVLQNKGKQVQMYSRYIELGG